MKRQSVTAKLIAQTAVPCRATFSPCSSAEFTTHAAEERRGEEARQGEATLICRQLISKRQSKARTRLMRSIRRIRQAKAPSAAEQVSPSECKEKECGRGRGGSRSYPCAACCINHADCPIQQRYVSLLHFTCVCLVPR